MFEYFPESSGINYWANHHFTMAVNCGLTIGDADHAFGPARAAARAGHDATTAIFREAFHGGVMATAKALEAQAAENDAKGFKRSGGDQWLRAAALYELLDWFYWPWSSPVADRVGELFRLSRAAFDKGVSGADPTTVPVTIEFEGHRLRGYFVPAATPGKAPVVVHLNGQHSSLHWHYLMGLPKMLADRGVASLLFDHPGVGYARYALGLNVRADTESYTAAAIARLGDIAEADPDRVGVLGGSLGGYRVPRAAAFDVRIKAAVVWGAHFDMYDSVRTDWPSVGDKLPHGGPFAADEQAVIDGLLFWTGAADLPALDTAIRALSLEGILERITAPLLVVHGAHDAQLAPWHAHRTVAEAVNAQAELLLVDNALGGDQHCNWDNPRNVMAYMCDWLAARLCADGKS